MELGKGALTQNRHAGWADPAGDDDSEQGCRMAGPAGGGGSGRGHARGISRPEVKWMPVRVIRLGRFGPSGFRVGEGVAQPGKRFRHRHMSARCLSIPAWAMPMSAQAAFLCFFFIFYSLNSCFPLLLIL